MGYDQGAEQRDESLREGHRRVSLRVDGLNLQLGQRALAHLLTDGRRRRRGQPLHRAVHQRGEHLRLATRAHRGDDPALVRPVTRQRGQHPKREFHHRGGAPAVSFEPQYPQQLRDELRRGIPDELQPLLVPARRGELALQEHAKRAQPNLRRNRRPPHRRRELRQPNPRVQRELEFVGYAVLAHQLRRRRHR